MLKRGCRTDLANGADWHLLPFYPFPDQAAEAPGKAWKMGSGGTRPQLSLSCPVLGDRAQVSAPSLPLMVHCCLHGAWGFPPHPQCCELGKAEPAI